MKGPPVEAWLARTDMNKLISALVASNAVQFPAERSATAGASQK